MCSYLWVTLGIKKLWALLQFHYGVGDAIASQNKTVKILQEKTYPFKVSVAEHRNKKKTL